MQFGSQPRSIVGKVSESRYLEFWLSLVLDNLESVVTKGLHSSRIVAR
jgi:hypothetical protein